MIVYHISVGSRYFRKLKYFFKNKADVDAFIKDLIKNPPFIDEEAKAAFELLCQSLEEDAIDAMFTLTKIDTVKCPKWRKLFRGEMLE